MCRQTVKCNAFVLLDIHSRDVHNDVQGQAKLYVNMPSKTQYLISYLRALVISVKSVNVYQIFVVENVHNRTIDLYCQIGRGAVSIETLVFFVIGSSYSEACGFDFDLSTEQFSSIFSSRKIMSSQYCAI